MLHIKDLPSPKGHPILGHLPAFRNNPNVHQILEAWVRECGELFRIRLGPTTFLVSADPDLNHQMMAQRPHNFRRLSKLNAVIREMGVTGVFNSEGETWRRHRIPVARALNVKKIRNFFPVLKEKTQVLLDKFRASADKGEPLALQKEFMRYTVDITTVIAFGYELDTIRKKENAFQRNLEKVFPMVNDRITAPFPIWRFVKRKKDRELDAALRAIEEKVHAFIRDAKRRLAEDPALRERPANLLESLLIEKEAETFSDEEIYGNVFTMLLAGEDTTSNSLSWAVFFLAQHPDMVRRIRAEAIRVYGPEEVAQSNEQLAELNYTHAVAQETLRIKPTTPQFYLEANTDVVIGDLHIPKDTKIILQNKVPQTNERYFTDPESFRPERWLSGKCPAHHHHAPEVVKTFGGGPRFCPGMYLAVNEMVILLSALCKQFDLELAVDPSEIVEQFAFTMYPGNLWVKLTPCRNDPE